MKSKLSFAFFALLCASLSAQPVYSPPTQAEAEAGTSTINRVWSALRVKQAIEANAGGGNGDVSADGPNHFTNPDNLTDFAFSTDQHDLAGGEDLTINRQYYDSLTANREINFIGTPDEGNTILLLLLVNNTPTLTIPPCKRVGQANTTITSLAMTNGVHALTFKYIGSAWYLWDDLPGSVNLATDVTGVLLPANGGTGGLTGMLKATAGTPSAATAGTDYTSPSSTESPTNKTIDANGTGNTLKWIEEYQLTHPHQVDGTGATLNTTATASTYGHATFSNSADQAGNYVIYRIAVPFDFDSATDLAAAFTFRLGAGDTGKHRYVISMADVTDSAGADSPTFSNAINLDFAGDASGASGDRESIAYATLTSWRTSLTASHTLVIKLARDGDDGTNDTSTQNSSDMNLKIKIGHSQ